MYYSGTVLLNMTEKQFWSTTPRKLRALLDVYLEVQGVEKDEPKQVYIDQIMM